MDDIARRSKETLQDLELTVWELAQLAEPGTAVHAGLSKLLLSLTRDGAGLDLGDLPATVHTVRVLLGLQA